MGWKMASTERTTKRERGKDRERVVQRAGGRLDKAVEITLVVRAVL